MKKRLIISGVAVLLTAIAAQASTPSAVVPPKKQLIGCMNKQMALSRTISYNEAMKTCKQLIKSQDESLVAVNEAKPAIAR